VTANIGVAGASANTTSSAHSTGIKTGDGEDTICNYGNIDVTATSSAQAGGGSLSLVGLSSGGSLAEAITDGIDAGGGNDTVINTGSITVGSVQDNDHPMVYSDVESVSISLLGISSATFGSRAQATGIIGGGGDDTIINTGAITVGDDHWMAKGKGYGFSGNFFDFFSLTSVGSTAEAVSTGIEGGDGNNTILNDSSGVLTVKATSYARTEGAADTTFGSPAAFASSTTRATATGITSGEGDDIIENKGKIDVYAYTWADPYSDSWAGWGSPRADSSGNATATAVGISAGEGQNFVTNTGVINVKALAETTPYAKANSDIDTTDAEAASSSEVVAYGIVAGSNDDMIQNQGDLIVQAVAEKGTSNDQRTTAWTDEVAKVGTSKNDPGIRSSATATGISAGGGTNQITNDGTIDVKATATGDGYAFAESDAYDTETIIWAVVDTTATGIATGPGSSQVINNGLMEVSATAISQTDSDSDSVDDADATGGATVTAKAWGINASGNNALVINAGALDVDANATTKGNSRADSGGDGYGTAIFEPNSNVDAVGISAGDGGTVWNKAQAQITVDAKAMIDVSANGDEFGTIGTSKETPGAKVVAKAVGISMGNGNNQIINDGSISVDGEGNINAGSRSLSTTRSTHTNAWALTDATATGLTVGKGESSITNTGELEVSSKSIAYLNDPDGGTGTYWRSDSYYNADAKTGAYAYSHATGIEASADNSGSPGNTIITNSGKMIITSTATAKGNSRGDSGAGDGNATTYAEASADAYGFVVGNGNKLVSIENSGTLEAKSTVDTFALAHGDDNSYAHAKSYGYAYGINIGDNNELVSIKNSGTFHVESTATADARDDEPTMYSESSTDAYGIKIGNSNSLITNSGVLDIRSSATATIYSDEGPAASTISSAYATAISTGDGNNTIRNDSQVQVIATAESNPSGGNSNSTNTATAQAIGIKTGSNSDTITLGTGSLINTASNASTFSYNGATSVSAIGIDAGDGANQITNYGSISVNADASAEVKREEIFIWSITYPATAVSNATGIKLGQGADIINNYGEIMVDSKSGAVINQVLDLSAGTKSATANAIGIDAGNGDNFIANYGSIDVSALAAAGTGASPRVRTDGVENTTAIGIKTGDGNDTIINSGTIDTANQRLEWVGGWAHITSQPGIAITSGAGNDQVFLMNGSITTGNIDLGDGDDWLTFVGIPLVTGNVTGGTGTDTLVFQGAGSIGFTPIDFENAIKQGAGTFTAANLGTMRRIEVNQGTLEVNSDYAMANDSTFQAKVNGDGSHGQLKVNGTTTLDGALKVVRGSGAYVNGTTYNILTGDTVNGWFTSETLPDPTPMVSFHVNPPRDRVEIEAQVNSFTTVSNNPTYNRIARYLDKILPTARGDLAYVLGEIQLLSEPGQFNTAFSSLSPDSYDHFTRATYDSTWQYIKSLQRRMDTIRSYGITSGYDQQAKPILLAYKGSDASLGQLFATGELSQTEAKNGLWLNAFGQWGDQEGDPGFTGFDYNVWGTTLGFDHTFGDNLIAGLSLGYSRTDIDLDGHRGDGDIDSLFGSLYGSYFNKNAYIEAAFSYGRNWYENQRLILVGPIQRRASSEHDGDVFSGYLGAGYYFNLKDWFIGPFGSLRYVYSDEQGFQEKGADSLNLSVDSRQTDSLVSELGLQVTRAFGTKYGSLIPEVRAAWSYDFAIDDRVITTSFEGSPGAVFSIRGQEVKRNGAVVGAGITFIHKSGFSTSLKYSGEFREGYQSHGVIGELRYTF
jgi:outer membrane autotransporter protein